ncbi:MAG TPA: ABC transporter ATP-binding protein [Acetobacteraceae bacterium]|nr:ABC transporter ATP-binding protein [Acetobacteraceae bacterium]
MAELAIEGLVKRFDTGTVLDRASLVVRPGHLLAVLGASGSGKTTLLRLIAGFERADAGTIAIDGVPVAGPGLHVPPERRRIGYLAQEGALFPHLSVGRNIAFGLGRGGDAAARVAELLEMVGLPAAYAARSPQHLSGGEQQRVALARTLAPEPRLVLLDEPFSALDAGLRQEVRQTVATALQRTGATAVLVTHDQAEALSMGDAVAVLRAGRIVQLADPVALYRRPQDAEVARFVGEAVLLPGQAHGGLVQCALGVLKLAAPMQGAVSVLIRPEQIRLVAAGTPGSAAAEIRSVQYFGHDALVGLSLTAAPDQSVVARVFSHALPPAPGRTGLLVDGAVSAFPAEGAA